LISDQFEDAGERRQLMVTSQLEARRIRDPQVLAAMRRVPRHAFVPSEHRDEAYADSPLPIGEDQTISQPYIVALMTEMLGLRTDLRVLEVGTGSGYQTAVLAEIVREIFTVEARVVLFDNARRCLGQLDYRNIQFRHGNGCDGWPEFAPFDRIIVTACAVRVPPQLVEQLSPDGIMVLPLAKDAGAQVLCRVTRTGGLGMDIQDGIPVRFVPMISEQGAEQ
jgi:protein-L-isoaspartate(D-aspartate) O-methyltransferase